MFPERFYPQRTDVFNIVVPFLLLGVGSYLMPQRIVGGKLYQGSGVGFIVIVADDESILAIIYHIINSSERIETDRDYPPNSWLR